jgi:hypothetical protein
MRKLFHVILVGIIVLGSFPIQSQSAPQKQEDCVICGHACCCPEMCAPKIKELKKKKAHSHCGVSAVKETAAKGCDQPLSICSLTSNDPISLIFLQERSVLSKPISWLVETVSPNLQRGCQLPPSASILSMNSPTEDVLTPPPQPQVA